MRTAGVGAGAVAVSGGLSSCFLIDVGSFRAISFDLPPKSYVIDPDATGLGESPVGLVPAVTCTPETAASACCDLPDVGTIDCEKIQIQCVEGLCELDMDFTAAEPVNLLMEVPDLKGLGGDVLKDVFLKKITFNINNGLNIHLPSIDVYVAPAGTTRVGPGSDAAFIVRVPAQEAMSSSIFELAVPPAGQEEFSRFATNFRAPFNIITSFRVHVKAGTLLPQGRADLQIGGLVEARV